jgi:hypothetical protein
MFLFSGVYLSFTVQLPQVQWLDEFFDPQTIEYQELEETVAIKVNMLILVIINKIFSCFLHITCLVSMIKSYISVIGHLHVQS